MKREWLSNPKGTDLFTTFRKKSGLFAGQPQTVQGFYCMTAEGDHLADKFARMSNKEARQTIQAAWRKFQTLAKKNNWNPKPIPNNKIELVLGDPPKKGGVKLQIASRDLPRGSNRRPGNAEWEREAYNINWLDLTPDEAAHFRSISSSKSRIAESVSLRFAKQTIKDNVRGQNGWHDKMSNEIELFAEQLSDTNGKILSRLSGHTILSEDGRKVAVQVYGQTEFDKVAGEYTRFDLVASGQRKGFAGANGRQHDQGPAPIGFAFRLYKSPKETYADSR